MSQDFDRTMLGAIITNTAIYCPWCRSSLREAKRLEKAESVVVTSSEERAVGTHYFFQCGMSLRIGRDNDIVNACPESQGRQFKEVAKEQKSC